MERPLILRIDSVMRETQLSKASIYRQIRAGTFPGPVRLGPRAVGWRRDAILRWLDSREPASPRSPQRRPGIETRGSQIHTPHRVDS